MSLCIVKNKATPLSVIAVSEVVTRVVVMVVCNCNRLQLITNSYVIVILIVIDDNFV